MNQVLNEKNIKTTFLLFLITYPIFDIRFFYNSITTLSRIAIVLVFFIYLIFNKKISKKYLLILLIYYLLVIIYSIFHHLNAINFKSLVPGNFDYNPLIEILQLLKLTIPVLFLIVLKGFDINKNEYYLVFKSWIVIICGSIIVLNIFGLSYGSYSDNITQKNIFDWINTEYSYDVLATKGLFMYANQISLIIVVLLIEAYNKFIESNKNFHYILVITFTGLIVGTRVSTHGIPLLIIFLTIIYLISQIIILKEKINFIMIFKIVLLLITVSFVIPYVPSTRRENTYNLSSKTINLVNKTYLSNVEKYDKLKTDKIDYIVKNYKDKNIYDHFILRSYPYQYDPDFWIEVLEQPYSKRIDYRYLEISMVKRVVEINDNKYDFLFGITNVRIQNTFNIERDFILQYYAFGIAGIILFLGIYIIMLLLLSRGLKFSYEYNYIFAIISVGVYLFVSFLTGNILNHLSVNLPFIFIISPYVNKKKYIE